MPAVLLTRARSARTNGLELEAQPGGTPAQLTYTGTGRLCPPLPDKFDLHRPHIDPTQPFSAVTDHRLDRPKGIEILNLFKPNLDELFGHRRIKLEETVERGTASNPQRGVYERLEITLELQRCKRQSPPARCGARR